MSATTRFDPAGIECEQPTGFGQFARRPLLIFRGLRREHVSADLIAGLTVAAVAIPQAIAYASIAELPPHYGLYTAGIGAIVGALWGCSRFLSTGPVNAVSLLVLPVLLGVAAPGTPEFLMAASLVAVMVGVLNLVLARMNFGALVTLASRSVLIGFTAGAAIHIAVGQVKHLLGLHVPAMPELHRTVAAIISGVGETNEIGLGLGLATIAVILTTGRIGPRIPAALVAIAAAAIAVSVFGLEERGVRVVGAIPRALPPPTWIATGVLPDLQMVRGLVIGAMAIAALGLIEAVAASQTLARRVGERLNNNQEFFGQGLANIVAGLFSGYPCSGSFTRSALAQQAGARTHLTGVTTGVAVLAGMLLLAPWARLVPRPAIAGVLLVVAWRMVDREGIRRVLRTSRSEAAVMIITFSATLVLPLDFAVLAGVVFSLAFFVIRSSLPRVDPVVPDSTFRHFVNDPERPVCPQLAVLNIRGPLFFGAVYHVEEELRHNHKTHPGQHFLCLRLHGVNICDLTGIEMLESTVKTYRELGGDVYLIRPRREVLRVMEQSGFLDNTLGRDHILMQDRAIEQLFSQVLDPAVCIYECEHRVFAECQALEKHVYSGKLPPTPKLPQLHLHDRFVDADRFQGLAADADASIFDIREPEEYRRGHVPGAGSFPLRMLPDRWGELPADGTILLVCRSGRRSSRALRMLESVGLSNVYALRGGILAWRAEGLPLKTEDTAESEVEETVPSDEASRGHLALAVMRLKQQTDSLNQDLERLSETLDLEAVREKLESLLTRSSSRSWEDETVIRLDPDRPVLIVSDAHAQRVAFRRLLLKKYVGRLTNLESIVQGDLQLLLLGDILHSENRKRWQAIDEEFATQFTSEDDEIGPTPEMDAEMADAFGLAAMIMTLAEAVPGVHCLKGNHDNLLNSEENGNRALRKLAAWPGEGQIAKMWTFVRFGSAFAGRYAAWELRLPLLAIFDSLDDGPPFAASHTDPGDSYTPEQIASRTDEIVYGLTWTRKQGHHSPDLLRTLFGERWARAKYFASHTGSEDGVVQHRKNNLVILNKPGHLVTALVRPGFREFEVRIIAGD